MVLLEHPFDRLPPNVGRVLFFEEEMINIFENTTEALRESIEQISLCEAKSAEDWWDRLPGKRKAKVVGFLALDKKSGKKIFSKLDADERSEVEAYFAKHKGKVEGIEDGGKSLDEERKMK